MIPLNTLLEALGFAGLKPFMSHFAQKSSLWQLVSGQGKRRLVGEKCGLGGFWRAFPTNFGSANLGAGEGRIG